MEIKVEKQPKSTYKITVKIPSIEVKKSYEEILAEVIKGAEVPGFRKGSAPKELVLEKTDVSKLYGEVVNDILQKFYPQALKEKSITPISNPKVEIKEFDLEKDFEFVATVAVKPEVKIKEFKQDLKKTLENKTEALKKENEEKLKKGEEITHDHVHLTADDLLNILLDKSEVEIAEILIEDETERMVSRFSQQVKGAGLSVDQYLTSQNKTLDSLKKDYEKVAEQTLKAEFVLSELVHKEGIEVSDEELNETIAAAGDPKLTEKMQNSIEKWYIKSVLQKNKLISKILEEVEGVKHEH